MKGAVLSELPGRATDAIASLDRAIEIDPGDSIPWFDRAWARKKSGDLPAALADAEQAEKLAPTSGENAFLVAGVRFDRAARAWATTRDLDGARAEWRLTVERCARATELGAPEPLKVSLLEARALTSLQEYSRATGVYTAALALAKPGSNQSVDVLNGLGVSHLNERRLDDAEADFRKALSIYGPERGLLANLGKCALVRGRYDEARARYGEALGKDPSWATAKLGRGIASWLGGQLDPAVADLTAASLEKGFEWVPFWVWEIEEERGSSKAAAAALERAQALAGSVASPTYVALIAYLRGEKSEDDVLSVVRNDIDRLNALYYLGAAAWARGRHEEARALFQKTIALHFPDQLEHVLAEAHLRRAP
jgi:tetratricopeptide (TPR) repeat protein